MNGRYGQTAVTNTAIAGDNIRHINLLNRPFPSTVRTIRIIRQPPLKYCLREKSVALSRPRRLPQRKRYVQASG